MSELISIDRRIIYDLTNPRLREEACLRLVLELDRAENRLGSDRYYADMFGRSRTWAKNIIQTTGQPSEIIEINDLPVVESHKKAIKEPQKGHAERAVPKSRFVPVGELSEDMLAWFNSHCMFVLVEDVEHETELCADWHRGKGTQITDWPATWRTWMNNKIKYNKDKLDVIRPEFMEYFNYDKDAQVVTAALLKMLHSRREAYKKRDAEQDAELRRKAEEFKNSPAYLERMKKLFPGRDFSEMPKPDPNFALRLINED